MPRSKPIRPYYKNDSTTLYHASCLDVMSRLGSNAVDSIVTSPEYADQRKYKHGAKTKPTDYADHFEPFLAGMLDVLRPAGSLMLNLGVIMRDGEENAYADEVLSRARSMGWKLLHRMVWNKSNALPLSYPDYLHVSHEWVFWLAKTTKVYRGYDADTRTPHAEGSVSRINQPYIRSKDEKYARRGKTNELHPDGARPKTVFTCAVGSRRGIKHPAPMAHPLALQLVSLSTPVGGLVLDPFVGSGTTMLAAAERGRLGIGCDINEEYLAEAVERLT